MLVKNWMTKDVVSIDEKESMVRAIELIKTRKIAKLPVTKEGNVVGIISGEDIKIVYPSEEMFSDPDELEFIKKEMTAKDVMARPVVTIEEEATIEKAAAKMLKYHVSGLPVLSSGGHMVGILTLGDIFKLLIEMTGLYHGTTQVAVCIEDRPGSIKDVADTIRASGGRIVSILSSYESAKKEGFRDVFIRYSPMESHSREELERKLREKFDLRYLTVDILNDL